MNASSSAKDADLTTIAVVLCAYTRARWTQLEAAIESVRKQTRSADEIIVVIDHNEDLRALAATTFGTAGSRVSVLTNTGARGLSGARNSGLAAARSSIVAFLDDDAVARPDWLELLGAGYRVAPCTPRVLGVGGSVRPVWPVGKPSWFPEAFFWVVGCSHSGLPRTSAPVRNFIGCNMSFRRAVLEEVGNFRTEIGRVGTYPAGDEETELCIRLKQRYPQDLLLYVPEAQVGHHVSQERLTLRYFLSRCYAEGLSKALLSRFVGSRDGLASERAYTRKVLPREAAEGVKSAFLGGELAGLGRAGSIVLGLCVTTAGYLKGRLTHWVSHKMAPNPPDRRPFEPISMLELDLTEPLPDLTGLDPETGRRYTRASLLVRLGADPIGSMELGLGNGVDAERLAALLWAEFGAAIRERFAAARAELALTAGGLTGAEPPNPRVPPQPLPGEELPLISVVIATHDRAPSLATCLASLARVDYPNFEVIVVDNAPSTLETYDLVQASSFRSLRYVREDTPGLAVAHNRGLQEAQGDIVAFTDDDVRVDRFWLSKLAAGFRAARRVGCVTGMIVPAELETPAQAWLEQYGGFSKGFALKVFDLAANRPPSSLYPYTAGIFGSGANMAFTREALAAIGGFDPALGAGSKGVGGDDLAAFFDVVASGYTLVYQPAAFVHHWHRRDYKGLQRQAYGYGVGLTAFLTKVVLDDPKRLLKIVPLVPRALLYALSPASPKNAKKRADYPSELSRLERLGMLYGPFAYLRSRWALRRRARGSLSLARRARPRRATRS